MGTEIKNNTNIQNIFTYSTHSDKQDDNKQKKNLEQVTSDFFGQLVENVADYLVKKGVPFRDAHGISGKLVVYCIDNNKNLTTLTLNEYKQKSELFEEDIYQKITPEAQVNNKTIVGSPSENSVMKVIKINEKWLKNKETNKND